jgi:hypothetical protein
MLDRFLAEQKVLDNLQAVPVSLLRMHLPHCPGQGFHSLHLCHLLS